MQKTNRHVRRGMGLGTVTSYYITCVSNSCGMPQLNNSKTSAKTGMRMCMAQYN